MNTVSGRDSEVLPTLKSQLHRLLIQGAGYRRDRLIAFIHASLAVAFFVLGVGVAIAIRNDGPRRKIALLLILPFLINTVIQFSRFRSRTLRMRRLKRIVASGFPVTAHVVQANPGLFVPGKTPLPCLVLFSHQPEVAADWNYLADLAQRVYSLKGATSDDPDVRFVSALTKDDRSVLDRRRKLPLSFTDGSTIYCADLTINPAFLPKQCLTGSPLPCFAEGGDTGGIELVPARLTRQVVEESALIANGSV